MGEETDWVDFHSTFHKRKEPLNSRSPNEFKNFNLRNIKAHNYSLIMFSYFCKMGKDIVRRRYYYFVICAPSWHRANCQLANCEAQSCADRDNARIQIRCRYRYIAILDLGVSKYINKVDKQDIFRCLQSRCNNTAVTQQQCRVIAVNLFPEKAIRFASNAPRVRVAAGLLQPFDA